MIYLAYDGSINGDWVAWYALNLARHDAHRRLIAVHVECGDRNRDGVAEKLDELAKDCAGAEVAFETRMVPAKGGADGVFRALVDAVPGGAETLLVCGARLKAGGTGYLAGTVSEQLLRDKTFPVMAVRVVQPGLLGAPGRFLMPVAGEREGFLTGAKILGRFGNDVQRVHLLRVMQLQQSLFHRLQTDQAQRLRDRGWDMMRGLNEELAQAVGIDAWKVDIAVNVSDDWAHDVIIAAGRHKTHLILMEASRHDLGAGHLYGNAIEMVLRDAPCDVAVYRGT